MIELLTANRHLRSGNPKANWGMRISGPKRAGGAVWRSLMAAVLGLLLLGCATSKIDWNSRVGTYTYDQALLELGPPDKSANLKDGTIVAEWLTRRGRSYYHAFPPAYSPYWYGPYYPTYIDSYSPDSFVRLIFSPDGRLQSWKRFYK